MGFALRSIWLPHNRLLSDPSLAARMREANWQYYQQEIEPARHVWNCLERAFAHADEPS